MDESPSNILLYCNARAIDKDVQIQLGNLVKYSHVFHEISSCEKHLRSIVESDRVILIITDDYGEVLLPRIDQLAQLHSIYVLSSSTKPFNRQSSKVNNCSKFHLPRKNTSFKFRSKEVFATYNKSLNTSVEIAWQKSSTNLSR